MTSFSSFLVYLTSKVLKSFYIVLDESFKSFSLALLNEIKIISVLILVLFTKIAVVCTAKAVKI